MIKKIYVIVFLIIVMSLGLLLTGCEKKNDEAKTNVVEVSDNNTTIEDNENKKDDNKNESEEDSKKETETIIESDGDISFKIKSSINIKDYINVEIPDGFEKLDKEDYMYSYYYGEDEQNPDITVKIAEIDENSASDFIKNIVKTVGLSEENDMYSTDVNDITWYILGYMTDEKIVYYNAFDKEGKVFLCRYDNKNSITDETLLNSYNEIIMSIKANMLEADDDEINKGTNDNNDENDTTVNTEVSNFISKENRKYELGAYVDIGTNILDLEKDKLMDGTLPKSDWRVFNEDENGVWLIFTGYMPNERYNPTSRGIELGGNNEDAKYQIYFKDGDRKKFFNILNSDFSEVIKDSKLYGKTGVKVKGGIDLANFVDSWNAKGYKKIKIESKEMSDGLVGYSLNWENESDCYSFLDLNDELDGALDTLYNPMRFGEYFAYWLATPSTRDWNAMVSMGYYCELGGFDIHDKQHGLRPVIYIPSEYQLDTSNEIYKLVE